MEVDPPVDPVDDGPMLMGRMDGAGPAHAHQATPMSITQEDDARQVIEMLRGDDVSERVSAATRLEAVAAALGEERTREVSSTALIHWCFSRHQDCQADYFGFSQPN